ncbi:MAG: tetratricopeptide repeat protein [Chthonomonadetes bacterium]|nr:tetratricopeptide repeat protein [Chthonomonadetes bacterium]
MFCTQCGAYNTDDSRFCHQCGHRLQSERKIPPLDESAFQMDTPEQQEKIQQLLNDALTHEAEGRLQEAILACEGVLVLDPANTSAHSLLGLIYEKQGSLQKAIAEYEKVVALNPDSVADRAKLEELRRRLHMPVPRAPREEPNYLPLIIGIFVTVGLFVMGLAALNYQGRPERSQPMPQPSAPAQPAPQTGYTPYGSYGWYQPMPEYTPSAPAQTPAETPAVPSQERTAERPSSSTRNQRVPLPPLPPLTVAPSEPTTPPQNNRQQANGGGERPAASGSVVMPDVPLQPNTSQQPTGRQPVMEITVRPGGSPTGSGVVAPPPASMEAEDLMRVAQQHQLAGRYREAIPLYQKALQGATDKGFVYQQIGLCYQRVGDLEAARNAYQQAIAEYERQIAANQNVERARRGLEAAKQGLAACGG